MDHWDEAAVKIWKRTENESVVFVFIFMQLTAVRAGMQFSRHMCTISERLDNHGQMVLYLMYARRNGADGAPFGTVKR